MPAKEGKVLWNKQEPEPWISATRMSRMLQERTGDEKQSSEGLQFDAAQKTDFSHKKRTGFLTASHGSRRLFRATERLREIRNFTLHQHGNYFICVIALHTAIKILVKIIKIQLKYFSQVFKQSQALLQVTLSEDSDGVPRLISYELLSSSPLI